MADTKQERFPDYPIFKGLQRPLEFFGLQGRYIYWAAATAGGAVAGFILGYCIFGFVAGLVLLVLAVAVGGVLNTGVSIVSLENCFHEASCCRLCSL